MNQLLRLSYVAWRQIQRLLKPDILGVRILLIKEESILLVKHTYQQQWYLPGGLVDKGESFPDAARREAAEELGVELRSINVFGIYFDSSEFGNDHTVVFYSNDFSHTGTTDLEIEQIYFFRFNSLPELLDTNSQNRIEEYLAWDGEVIIGPW